MALSLSQVSSHLASTLGGDAHGPNQDLLRLGGGSAANRFDHLLRPSSASAFRPLPPPAFLMAAPPEFGEPFQGFMHLPDLLGKGASVPSASSAPGLFNLGFTANSTNSSGTSSHGHTSQGHLATDQLSKVGAGGGRSVSESLAGNFADSDNQIAPGGMYNDQAVMLPQMSAMALLQKASRMGSSTITHDISVSDCSESSAAMLFSDDRIAGGDNQVAHGGMYDDQAMMLPQISATALLQKASQVGSRTSTHGGPSVFGGLVGSSSHARPEPDAPAEPMLDQSQIHLQRLMNPLASGGMFVSANSGGMIDPRMMYGMDEDMKFSKGLGDTEMTRETCDFLGVGVGRVTRGMPVARGEHHEEIVGRLSDKREIMGLIKSDYPSNKHFTIVCIKGADGLGKTTLASLVYWDDTTRRSFETRAWQCLSNVCCYEELLRSVIASLTGVSCRIDERDELEELLKEELVGTKFLLVLDNLCENSVEICRHLLPLLSVGDKGSAVMVTTSSNLVASHLGTAHAYDLKALTHASFLALAKPSYIEYSPLQSIISKIPSECSGFPVFAKAIRGILYSAFTQQRLDDTVGSKLTDILSRPDNHLHYMLDLSYSYLPPNQKWCLLYCSMFPRHYIYTKEKLLRLWMSQGFIVPDKENHQHDSCEDAFYELLHRSFFDHCPSSEVKEQKYIMHDIPSNLARLASDNKFFRAHDHELHCIPEDVHHLSIIPKLCDSEIYFSSFTEFTELGTFLLVPNSQLESTDSQFHVMDVEALDECLRNFRCLKTLDLSHTDLRELPESIGYVTSLCFLGLNSTNLRRLPNSVCNLFNLQTLELQNSAFLVELPNDIKNLTSLYHLDASKEHGPIYIPPGIGGLTNLRTLTTFTVGGVSWNCKISELAHLNSLKGSFRIQSLNNVENAEDAKGACLAAKKLKKLSLEWCHSGEDTESDDRIYVAEHVLDALQPHTLLEELNIKGYYGLEFPSWMAYPSLSNLVSVTLDNCYNCEKLPPLGALPALRCLFIQNLRGVQLITHEFCATGTTSHKSFPKLEVLKLHDIYSLEYWHDVLDGDFPSLRCLSIERCPKLNSMPCFQFISDISIMSCSKLNLPGLPSLETLKVGSLKQRKSFVLPDKLRSLLTLEITCCEHLCSLDGLSRLHSLKHLKLRTCPRLNFAQDEPLPETLETVDVHSNCYVLSNWQPNGFEELADASEVYRKYIRHKCKDKGNDDKMMHEP